MKDLGKKLDNYLDVTLETVIAKVKHGVSESINQIASDTRTKLSQTGLKINSPMKEGGTLMEGIRAFMYRNDGSDYIHGLVHILGNRNTNDGTWRLRFFEGGTKERMVKRTKKKLGKIGARWFFADSLVGAESMTQTNIDNSIQTALNKVKNIQ